MIGIGVGIFILMKLDSTIVIELRCHISGDYLGLISLCGARSYVNC